MIEFLKKTMRPSSVTLLLILIALSAGILDFRADGRLLPVVAPSSAWRALEAARVAHAAGAPLVIASGGVTHAHPGAVPESDVLRLALIALDHPPDRTVPRVDVEEHARRGGNHQRDAARARPDPRGDGHLADRHAAGDESVCQNWLEPDSRVRADGDRPRGGRRRRHPERDGNPDGRCGGRRVGRARLLLVASLDVPT